MNSIPKIDAALKLSNNLSKLLLDLAKDFNHRSLKKCHERGHTKIRRSHSSLFSNLGFEAVRLTELAERAGITQQAMGKLVKEMERVGYVKRHIDESDKRAKIIELTEQGVVLVNDSMEIVDEVIAEYTSAMGQEGILDLEGVLRKSVSSLGISKVPDNWQETKGQINAA
ncbi:MAG: winged helix-turn-helix transcriptional regulator [Oceanicoccus sp.]|uniref:MarR family winged helix-turn-helix transcriptional regulator n=1 Tax=Oceanicoccus sp. TaxID=2691044 RepID=UPI002636AAA3|nr:MarR family winged helix-turn-helix transcriptional regulator [Oceanicoccus sp.]MCP3906674.1 winged helix-turn-helix transcriptional regulator [Oceanicoccus sp.]MDG1772030.1 MarR family winged helix-turn-helix transcriptional regulator [Oceanicoccus sp.]